MRMRARGRARSARRESKPEMLRVQVYWSNDNNTVLRTSIYRVIADVARRTMRAREQCVRMRTHNKFACAKVSGHKFRQIRYNIYIYVPVYIIIYLYFN